MTDQSTKEDVAAEEQMVVDNNNEGDNLVCRQRLTEDQSERLRNELQKDLQLDQDVLDYTLAMLSNEKSVGYIVKELLDTELCPKANQMGEVLIQFLSSLPTETTAAPAPASSTTPKLSEDTNTTNEKSDTSNNIGSRVISLKSTKKSNALTMSGALGSSRQGGKTKPNNNDSSHPNKTKKKVTNETNKKSSTLAGKAFERLSSSNNNNNNNNKRIRRQRDGGNRGGRNNNHNNERRGRGDGNRGGRGENNNHNNNNRSIRGNHSKGGNFKKNNNNSHLNPEKENLPKSKKFRPSTDDPVNENSYSAGNNDNNNSKEYPQNHYNRSKNFHSFPNRSWRGGRNAGRGEGARQKNTSSEDATLAAAEASPSPLVAATFGGRFGGGRGGGRFGGGRFFGGRHAGRMHVQAILASKTWTRKKSTGDATAATTSTNTTHENAPTTD